MDEDKKKDIEKEEPKTTKDDTPKGSEPKATTLVDDANAAAERLEKANERKAELLRQEEEIIAKRALGGGSEAGQEKEPELTAEEKASKERIDAYGRTTGSSWAEEKKDGE